MNQTLFCFILCNTLETIKQLGIRFIKNYLKNESSNSDFKITFCSHYKCSHIEVQQVVV